MKQTITKLAVLLISVGVFVFCIRNESVAVTEDSTNSVNLQGTVNESIDLTKAIFAGKELVGVAGEILLGSFNVSASNDFTPGGDFAAAYNDTFVLAFQSSNANACLVAAAGFEFEQTGQATKDNRITFLGSAVDLSPSMKVGMINGVQWYNGALGVLSFLGWPDYFTCTPGSWTITAGGFARTDTGAGNTAETFLRNVTTEFAYLVPNLKTPGTRTHSFQVRIEAVAGI